MIEAHVTAVALMTPSMVRLTLAGAGIADLAVTEPTQWLKVFIPRTATDDWVGRAYTIRGHRPDQGEVDIEVVLHGNGPVAQWAASTSVGDVVRLGDLKGRFEFPGDARWWLVAADESAQPAAITILEAMAPGVVVTAFFEVESTADERVFGTGEATVHWLHRSGAPKGASLAAAVAQFAPGDGPGYVWVAGEATSVRSIHLALAASGLHRSQLRTKGYWKLGQADLRA